MKVLMVNKFLHPNGGSETYIFKIGEQLNKLGHEVQYFGMDHENRCVGNRIDCYTQNMDFHTGKLQKFLYPFKIIYSIEAKEKMIKVLENFEPDVVHFNNINYQLTPSVIDAVKEYKKKTKRKIKMIATAHDYQWVCPNHMLMIPSSMHLCFACEGGKFFSCTKNKCIHNSRIKSILGSMEAFFYKMRKTYAELDIIICPSEFLNKKLSTDPILRKKTLTLHNFVFASGNVVKESSDTLQKKYNLPERYVLYFGRYAKEKGIETLIKICEKLNTINFVFAGSGPLEQEVEAVQNIINVGFQSGQDLQQLIMKAQFCVYPSEWYENCPFSVMEAQMYGVPVIASDLGGTSELIQDHITGELYRGGEKEELQVKIMELWENSYKLDEYKKNCEKMCFITLEEYCQELLKLYA